MPTFVVETNVSESDFPADWHKKATELISRILGKPVQVRDNYCHACFYARQIPKGRLWKRFWVGF